VSSERAATGAGDVRQDGAERGAGDLAGDALPRQRRRGTAALARERPFLARGGGAQARLRAAAVDSGWWSEEEERPCFVSLFLIENIIYFLLNGMTCGTYIVHPQST
jgi:hypothetical protein